jgi:hypothetical protein
MSKKLIRRTKHRRKYKLGSSETMTEYQHIIERLNELFNIRYNIIKSIHDSTNIIIDTEEYESHKTTSLINEWLEIYEHNLITKQIPGVDSLISDELKKIHELKRSGKDRAYLLIQLNNYQDTISQEQLLGEFLVDIKDNIKNISMFISMTDSLQKKLESLQLSSYYTEIIETLDNFSKKIKPLVNSGSIKIFQSIMLEELMNPNNWSVYDDIRIEYNLLYMLDKKQENLINFFSVLNKYDELSLTTDDHTDFESSILSYVSKPKLIKYLSSTIAPIIKQKYNIKNFNTFYNSGSLTFKELCEDLLDILYTSIMLNYKESFMEPLLLSNSHNIPLKYNVNPYDFFNNNHTPEHGIYLFFKDALNMMYYPNPTSNPQHEKQIMRLLKKYKFTWVDNYTNDTNKITWYKDKRLEPGQFVEQPNGSTAHPDFWIQLTNMRLSVEAKSNQGFYPMYGKTPPPEEVVYIFSSKKKNYNDKVSSNGRTTFSFGHALLPNEIRKILKGSKNTIKMIGKKLEWEMSTLNNHSGVTLKSDVDFLHAGSNSSYWKDNRNLIREQQVLTYNWLEPEGGCDKQIKSYTCMIPVLKRDVIKNSGHTRDFTCTHKLDRSQPEPSPKIYCSCATHNKDFEDNKPFPGNKGFTDLFIEGITRPSYYSYKIQSTKRYWCHMCVMKYYTVVNRGDFEIDSLVDILVVGQNIYYKVKYRDYTITSWQLFEVLVEDLGDNNKLFIDFWKNIHKQTSLSILILPATIDDNQYFNQVYTKNSKSPKNSFFTLVSKYKKIKKTSLSTILSTSSTLATHLTYYLTTYNPTISTLLSI